MRYLLICLVVATTSACKLTPTRDVRKMAEAAADPNSGRTYSASDVHLITLNQLLSKTTYTCATHRDVLSKHPGRCPVCDEELVAMPKNMPVVETGLGERPTQPRYHP